MAKGYGERRVYRERRDYRPPRGGYNRGGYRERYNDDRYVERRDDRRDYQPRYRRDDRRDYQPERFYGNKQYEDRDRPPRRARGSNFRGSSRGGRGAFKRDRAEKLENGDSKRGGGRLRGTGRRGGRGGMRGGKKNETKDTMEDYWKKDAEFMKLKLNKELEDYMKGCPEPNNETKNETKEETKAE